MVGGKELAEEGVRQSNLTVRRSQSFLPLSSLADSMLSLSRYSSGRCPS